MMGAGIAYATAIKGIPVILKDVSVENAEKGKAYSQKLLDKRVSQGRMTAEKRDQILSLITATASAEDLQGCDLIIEAVFENQELKAKVTQEAEQYLAPNGVMASNTSTLPITGLAQASKNDKDLLACISLALSTKCSWLRLLKVKTPPQRHLPKPMTLYSKLEKRQLLSMTAVASLPVVCLVLLFKKVCAYLQKASIQRVLKWQH